MNTTRYIESVEVYENDVATVEVRTDDGLTSFDALLVSDGEYARITLSAALSSLERERAITTLLERICTRSGQPDLYFWTNSKDDTNDTTANSVDVVRPSNDRLEPDLEIAIHTAETAVEQASVDAGVEVSHAATHH